jgi:hypothetical protein
MIVDIEIDVDAWVADRAPRNPNESNVTAYIAAESERTAASPELAAYLAEQFDTHGGPVRVLPLSAPAVVR